MLAVSVVGLTTPDLPNGGKSQPVGIAIVFLLFLFIFFYKPTWGATTWIWTAEAFSYVPSAANTPKTVANMLNRMNVRAQAVGMCSQSQNVANTIFNQFFPTFLNNVGLKCLFFFMGMNIVLFLFVWFFVPETKQVPLEEVDVLFGGANHVDKGAQIIGEAESHATHIGEAKAGQHGVSIKTRPEMIEGA